MAQQAPSFQWYPKDCDTDEKVRLMDDSEFGFFVRCLNHSWLNDGLPESMEDISRLLSRPRKTVEKYWARVGRCFTLDGGRWRNRKQEEQRTSSRNYSDARRKAAETRWGKEHPPLDAYASQGALQDAMHMQCPASASSSASASALTAAGEASQPPPEKWPQTSAAIGRMFPLSDVEIVRKITAAATEADPKITDGELSRVIESARKRNQKSAGLFLTTVPAILRNRKAQGRDSPENQQQESEEAAARALDLYSRADPQTRQELEKMYPELLAKGEAPHAENRTA